MSQFNTSCRICTSTSFSWRKVDHPEHFGLPMHSSLPPLQRTCTSCGSVRVLDCHGYEVDALRVLGTSGVRNSAPTWPTAKASGTGA